MMKEPPIPMDEIIRWCEANRPDAVEMLRAIAIAQRGGHPSAEGMMFIASIAFTSGRAFEASPVNADTFLPQAKDPYQ
jgi:hypothetical protein